MAVNTCYGYLVSSRVARTLSPDSSVNDRGKLTVNLPELLAATSLDPESMGVLKENMVQFLA